MNAPTTYYDYQNQAYVLDGVYARCGHPDIMDCSCYGKLHEGEIACTHDYPRDWIANGNQGGFAVGQNFCSNCGTPLPAEA
jgi:hypothetical protein